MNQTHQVLALAFVFLFSLTGCNQPDTNNSSRDKSTAEAQRMVAATMTEGPNLLVNPSFEAGATSWSQWVDTSYALDHFQINNRGPRTGAAKADHWDPNGGTLAQYTSQNLSGIANGTYTLRAWVRSSGDLLQLQLGAKNFGSPGQMQVNLPTGVISSYALIELKDIPVTNNSIQVFFWTKATAGAHWSTWDDLELVRTSSVAAPTPTATPPPAPTPTPTPTPTPAQSLALQDEFVGPFSSWKNVKVNFGAKGDGISDDTNALQAAINSVALSGGTLYLPAGTYIISQTLTGTSFAYSQIIGENPATMRVKWVGAVGGTMVDIGGYFFSNVGRITWDGSGTAGTIWFADSKNDLIPGRSGGTNVMRFDEVFMNAQKGLRIGDGANGADDTYTIIRCAFKNNSVAAVSVESWNALNIWVWYSKFENNAVGITNRWPAGNFFSYHNTFINSSETDFYIRGGPLMFGIRWNHSLGSKQFIYSAVTGQNTQWITVQGNTVLDTRGTAIGMFSPGELMLVDNVFRTAAGVTAPTIDASPGGWLGGGVMSIGNTYSQAYPIRCVGSAIDCWQLDDATVAASSIQPAPPANYPTPPNRHRQVFEIAANGDGAAIQSAINSAAAYAGQRPVVHIPQGYHPVAAPIIIPAGLDVQIVGDGYTSHLAWTSSIAAPMLTLRSPSKALVQDLRMTGNHLAEGLRIGSEDNDLSRIQVRHTTFTGSQLSVGVQGLSRGRVNLYGIGTMDKQAINVAGAGAGTKSVTSVFGGTLNAMGIANGILGLSNSGNLLVEDSWFEGTGQSMTKLSGNAGNLTISAMQYAPYQLNGPAASIDNYSGTFAWLGSNMVRADQTPITITNPTLNTNVVYMGGGFAATNLFNATPGGFVYARDNMRYSQGSYPTPDIGGTMPAAKVRSALQLMRQTLPSLNSPLPVGVSDVQINRIWPSNMTTGIRVVPGL